MLTQKKTGSMTIFWWISKRPSGCISIKGQVCTSWNCSHPSFIFVLWRAQNAPVNKQELQNTDTPPSNSCVYHQLYILHWFCLKIYPERQTSAGVKAWSLCTVHGGKIKLDTAEKEIMTFVNSERSSNQVDRCICGVSLSSRVTKLRGNHVDWW